MALRSGRLGGLVSGAALLGTLLGTAPMNALASHPQSTLTYAIGLSLPYGQLAELSYGIERGVRVAVAQANASNLVPGTKFTVLPMDDTVSQQYSGEKDANNARVFIQDSRVIGEVGPLNSGAAQVSMPVYNTSGLVQISPSNTGPALTLQRAKYEPTSARTGSAITYFRTCTTDAYQGPEAALYAARVLKAKSVYVTDNQDTYGVGLSSAFKAEAQKLGMKVLGYGEIDVNNLASSTQTLAASIANLKPDVVYFGGEYGSKGGAEILADALRKAGSKASFMGGDGIYASDFINGSSNGGAFGAYATSVGGDPTKDPNAQAYLKAFHNMFPGKAVEAYDTYSYDAANVILHAFANAVKKGMFKAGAAMNKTTRLAIAKMVLATSDMHGATGNVAFDKNGDSTNHAIGVYHVVGKASQKSSWHWIFESIAPQV